MSPHLMKDLDKFYEEGGSQLPVLEWLQAGILFIYLWIYGCAGSWLLWVGFIYLEGGSCSVIGMVGLLIVGASLVVEQGF